MNKLKSGTIAIVGRPNVGKSTLLNHLIGEKISIVSRKAQTTRHRIMGIRTQGAHQYVFVDTPGFQTRHGNALNKSLNKTVTGAVSGVDLILLVVETGRFGAEDARVLELLPPKVPVLLQPMVAVVPLQLFACELATLMGHDVDQPRNLAKSVTVE